MRASKLSNRSVSDQETELLLLDALTHLRRAESSDATVSHIIIALDYIGNIALTQFNLQTRFPTLSSKINDALCNASDTLIEATAGRFADSSRAITIGIYAIRGLFSRDNDGLHDQRVLHLGLLKVQLKQLELQDELDRRGNSLNRLIDAPGSQRLTARQTTNSFH